MEFRMHQKAKAAWQSKYGYYKFRWGSKIRFKKNLCSASALFPATQKNTKQKIKTFSS